MWLIWKWRKTKDRFSEIKIEINQKVKNYKFFLESKKSMGNTAFGTIKS